MVSKYENISAMSSDEILDYKVLGVKYHDSHSNLDDGGRDIEFLVEVKFGKTKLNLFDVYWECPGPSASYNLNLAMAASHTHLSPDGKKELIINLIMKNMGKLLWKKRWNEKITKRETVKLKGLHGIITKIEPGYEDSRYENVYSSILKSI